MAAADGPFGGLVASGWHTTALFMGMSVRAVLLDSASMGSPGVDEIRWTAPVRPAATFAAARPRRPDRASPHLVPHQVR